MSIIHHVRGKLYGMEPGQCLSLGLEMFHEVRLMQGENIGDRILEGVPGGAWYSYVICERRRQITFTRHYEGDGRELYSVEVGRRYLYDKTTWGTYIRNDVEFDKERETADRAYRLRNSI